MKNFESSERKESGYILTITDIFSRFTKLYFVNYIDSQSIIKGINKWIEQYGKPRVLVSDNGRQYVSRETKEFMKKHNIQHNVIPIYTPSSNGIFEAINKTISFVLSISKGKKIKDIIMRIEKAINTNYNRSIKASPLSIIRKYNLYDPFNTKIEFKYPFKENKINYVKVGDYCREKLYGAKKLEPKYSGYKELVMVSRKGYWVKLKGNRSWTHIKNLKM